ncbi:DUF445 family protein [Iamia sp. SCSIO 61187]|uniref:DUF445 domain-containing protein n=1 Tax=Iamia sp. SCSIO 61187 TaxID=2722752 RepID=UPI001C631082|nr:DUF445 family protein [Iamia sp. SCSIO 61187]QYG94471.1 DUF445 family protein [Iamia sp. SCSIO 61187]
MRDTALVFITIPLITAFIGYITNWAAVKMVFHPSEPWGIGPLKWQGIVYRLAPKLATEIATTTGHVLSPEDMVERLDAHGLMRKLIEERPNDVDAIFGEALDVVSPGTWAGMAPEAREQVRTMVLGHIEQSIGQGLVTMGERAEDLIDLDRLMVEELSGPNADRLARVAQEVGHRELRFIELYGGVFGFLIGIVQAAAYTLFSLWWTMPIVGAIVGLGTNWLAIQMIFRPLEPRRYVGLVTYQGMFPKRQAEIAYDYGRIAAHEVLTPANLIDHVTQNPAAGELVGELVGQARAQLDQLRPVLAVFAGDEVTDDHLDKVTVVLTQRLTDLLPQVRPLVEEHLSPTLRLDELIEERLAVLDKHQFERMLRGIFEEDEIILVLIGGALGGAVGALQGAAVFATGW